MKKIFFPFLATVIFTGLFSCKKQLDLLPTDAIDITKAFLTVDDLEKGLLGVYSANNQINKTYIATILADEAKISNENRGQGQFEYKWQYTSGTGGVTAAYRQYYTMIDRIHRVEAAAPSIVPADGTQNGKKARILAELQGLKGIAYFESLINVMPPGYDPGALGLALVNESCLTCTPSRNTVGEVIAEIENKLGAAKSDGNIPDAPTDPLRLSKASIAAYQARVALLKKDWTAAATFATEAITLSGKILATGNAFIGYWSDANESETILKYRNQTAPALLWRDANGDVFFEPSIQLKNLFDRTDDLRFSTYFSSAGTDTSIVSKYKGSSFGANINDLKIIRLAEMYLIRAEANAENNQLAQAANDINALRAARITGYVSQTFADKTEAINAVMIERTKELCYEGFRYYDLKRRSLPVNRLAVDVQSTTWQNLAANDYRFTLPIPQDAIDANPNTVQNQGY
ncbi:MAG TPA: RagB/SusD family nutrient uptake outer membrane protein [Chitinophagaceae bacterium]|nr:RagB/SusD family nutrient uptake outer membrane protein [Chitinophagaceae bacterium]